MVNTLQKYELEQIEKLGKGKKIDSFQPGDTVKVGVKIIEGENERIQMYEGVVIGRKNRGLNSSFTVRKISHGEGVERIFPLYSPRIASVELVRTGSVSRAKLYYIRELEGKAARIKERAEKATAETATAEGATASAKTEAAPKVKAEKKAEPKAKKASK